MNFAVGSVMLEPPVERAVDQTLAVFPGHITTVGVCRLQPVGKPTAVVLQLTMALSIMTRHALGRCFWSAPAVLRHRFGRLLLKAEFKGHSVGQLLE